MNHCYKYLILICVLLYGTALLSVEQNQRSLSAAEGFAVGAAVSGAEVIFPGQILAYATNRAINKKPFVMSDCYRGFSVHFGSIVPIGAVQKMVQTTSSSELQRRQGHELSRWQKACVSYMAGVAGSLIDTPLNAVQLGLQDELYAGKSSRYVMRSLGRNMVRGWAPNAFIKEGPFAVGYQMLAAEGQHTMQNYVQDEHVAQVLGGVGAGVLTALITQPGAVLRNRMQGDLFDVKNKAPYKTTLQTMQQIVKNEGVCGLWSGWKQRSLRMVCAVPLYAAYTSALEHKLREHRK